MAAGADMPSLRLPPIRFTQRAVAGLRGVLVMIGVLLLWKFPEDHYGALIKAVVLVGLGVGAILVGLLGRFERATLEGDGVRVGGLAGSQLIPYKRIMSLDHRCVRDSRETEWVLELELRGEEREAIVTSRASSLEPEAEAFVVALRQRLPAGRTRR